jgi:myo-inositol 2-dehydrogenase/D-chiro-inositol 1-dehydrogenase
MGHEHLEALEGSERVQVVAVADPNPRSRALAEARGLSAFGSLAQLVDAGAIDAAIVASPTGSHLEVVRTLTQAGIPVLCEKPCGRTSLEAHAAGELASRAKVALQVGYWKRFVPSVSALRERIRRGELGEISLVSCFQWDERPPPAGFRAGSGGPLVDMAVHELDLMRWLTNQEVVAARGFASPVGFDLPVKGDPESVAVATMLSGGALGLISVGRRFTEGDTHRVEVIGTEGAENLPFVRSPDGRASFHAALLGQAESFANAVDGALVKGATADDAVAALEAAAFSNEAVFDG